MARINKSPLSVNRVAEINKAIITGSVVKVNDGRKSVVFEVSTGRGSFVCLVSTGESQTYKDFIRESIPTGERVIVFATVTAFYRRTFFIAEKIIPISTVSVLKGGFSSEDMSKTIEIESSLIEVDIKELEKELSNLGFDTDSDIEKGGDNGF